MKVVSKRKQITKFLLVLILTLVLSLFGAGLDENGNLVFINKAYAGAIQTLNLSSENDDSISYSIYTTNLVIISKSPSISSVTIGSGKIYVNFDPAYGVTTRENISKTTNKSQSGAHFTSSGFDSVTVRLNFNEEYDMSTFKLVSRGELWFNPDSGSSYSEDARGHVDHYKCNVDEDDYIVYITVYGNFSSGRGDHYFKNVKYKIDQLTTTYTGTIQYAYNVNPTISVTAPAAGQFFSSVTGYNTMNVSGTVKDTDTGDILKVYYRIDGSTGQAGTQLGSNITANGSDQAFSGSINISSISEGNHTLYVWAEDDKTGKSSETSRSFSVDKTPPTLEAISITSAYNSITITGSATDNIAGLYLSAPYKYTVDSTVIDWMSGTSYTKDSLTPNTSYAVKYEARDAVGNITTYTQNKFTQAQLPSPSISSATSSSLEISTFDSNPSTTLYRIKTGSQYVSQSGTLTSTETWITLTNKKVNITGLSPNTAYTFYVTAKNGAEEPTGSPSVSGTTLPLPPVAPIINSIVSTANSIAVYWNAVAGATGYDILKDGIQLNDVTSPYTHTGLQPGTQHTYQVRAKNAGGTSAWSTPVTNTWTTPGAPTGLSGQATNNSVTVSWNSVSGATGYILDIDGSQQVDVGTSTAYNHNSLLPNTSHIYKVKSKGSNNDSSSFSTPLTKYTLANTPNSGSIGNITGTGIETSWTSNGNPAGTSYAVGVFNINDQLVKQNPWTTSQADVVMGLTAETTYKVKVKAKNYEGMETGWYEIGTATTLPNPPAIPSNITATAEEDKIVLTWSPIDGVDAYDVIKDGIQVDNVTSPYTDANLTPGTRHTYKVRARKGIVPGDWSNEIIVSTKLPIPPNITATAKDSSITLRWESVADGDEYQIEKDGNSQLITVQSGTEYEDTNLMPCTTHTYRIRVKNSVSESDWSELITKTTTATPPQTPGNIDLTPDSTKIIITWDSTEGTEGYDVKADGRIINAGTDTTYEDTGLLPGTQHTYQLRARNTAGKSGWSAPMTVSTVPLPPDIPANLSAYVTDISIEVTWDEVDDADEYIIEIDEDTEVSVTDAIYAHTDLTPGSEHTYRVRSNIEGDFSDWSTLLTISTLEEPESRPGTPINIDASVSENEIILTWDRVNSAQSYDIEMNDKIIDGTQVPRYEKDGLSPGTPYSFRIRAKNQNGEGDWSSEIHVTTLPDISGIPGIPQDIRASATGTSVTITWEDMENADSYDIELNSQVIDNISVASYVYSGLDYNTACTFRARAVNEEGTGEWSDPVAITTLPRAPGIPQNVAAIATETSITVSWNVVEGAEIYEIDADGTVIPNLTDAAYTHLGLTPGTQHTYRVRAKNQGGVSDWTQKITVLTRTGITGVPQNINVASTDTTITVSWEAVEGAQGYDIYVDDVIEGNVIGTSYTDEGLVPGTQHNYRVRAVTGGVPGNFSAQITGTTLLSLPGNITATSDQTQVTLSWDVVEGATGYEVEINETMIVSVAEPSYTHTGLMPGSIHTYRVKAKNDISMSEWSGTITKDTSSLTYTFDCSEGEIFDLMVVAVNVTELNQYSFTIQYNPTELELADLSGVTQPLDTEIGTISGTDISVKEVEVGKIVFSINRLIAPGEVWSGLVNSIKFKSKITGQVTIDYSIN